MERVGDTFVLSATDLVGYLNCHHLTELDRAVATGALGRPYSRDPLLELLWKRGARHEQGYVEHLQATGLAVTHIEGVGVDQQAVQATLAAMRAAAPVIIQGALRSGRWAGRADVLRRVDVPSALGAWSYEALDTKLARETRAGAVLQLCLYSELLEAAQGLAPESAYVVVPWTAYVPQVYRIADYGAYFRRVKATLERALDAGLGQQTYPDPIDYCDVCRWRQRCEDRRRNDDHLSLVAGITKVQINELRGRGVTTVSELAAVPLPLPWRPERGARQSYERIREQARIQLQGRAAGELRYELLPVATVGGLPRLPEPTDGDIFLDLEGDPFVGDSGLEYLFGYAWRDEAGGECYIADWALTRQAERQAFERFIDFTIARLELWPGLHVYHFAAYEPSALRRLMGRYATREEELDRLLRMQVFVDLYAVTRHGIRASVESYSIKKLEPLYGFKRETPLPKANQALAQLQAFLELGDLEEIGEAARNAVASYNRDDCISTWRLRDWLEARRAELISSGKAVERPAPEAGGASDNVTAWLARISPVVAQLTAGVPDDPAERTPEQHGRWLLGNMLDWHRREQKAVWWEFFRLRDLTADDLLGERSAVSGLEFEGTTGGIRRAPVQRYRFPPQEAQLRPDDDLRALGGAKFGKVEAISGEERWIDIKKREDCADLHPEAVFLSRKVIRDDVMAESLVRLGEHVAVRGLAGMGPYQAARDLLLRERPRVDAGNLQTEGESALDAALRLARAMPPGILPVQGPPGTGKTYTGARMICRLVAAGKTVAITATGHEVIRNLINEVLIAAPEMGVSLSCLQKPKAKQDNLPQLRFTTDNAAVFAAIGQTCEVAGGTAWLWSRPEALGCVDVLVVDEAAQMSLANVLAVSQAAPSLILLGDPQQLDQPLQGSHPEGTEVSALHHLLQGRQTILPDRGLFLEETWRLHPDICAFTSQLFYEGRLRAKPGLERQEIRDAGSMSGHGLRYAPILHEGNQSSSPEEAEYVRCLIREALASEPTWVDSDGEVHPLRLENILIIAPYNAQVFELQKHLPGARIGTVDKFQGQQAPLVIYSMTTSSYADAPRGLEFLYSLNRLNVASSRAKCICVLVASPAVLAADCRTPRQMRLVNAFCRYIEIADPI